MVIYKSYVSNFNSRYCSLNYNRKKLNCAELKVLGLVICGTVLDKCGMIEWKVMTAIVFWDKSVEL